MDDEVSERGLRTFYYMVFGRTTGFVCIAALPVGQRQLKERFFEWPRQLDDMLAYVSSITEGHNVYFCPQVFNDINFKRETDGKGPRVKENIKHCPVAWADLDTCNPTNMLVTPTITLETSYQRFQALWLLEDPVEGSIAEDLSRRIAYHHADQGADKSGWDLTQLLRIPGTKNYNHDVVLSVQIRSITGASYRIPEFGLYPKVDIEPKLQLPMPEQLPTTPAVDMLHKLQGRMHPDVWKLFNDAPKPGEFKEGWSGALWKLIMHLYEAGLDREDIFVVCKEAACNKYKRDGLSDEGLWNDIIRGYLQHQTNIKTTIIPELARVDLLTAEEEELVRGRSTFVERYIEWAAGLGDAAVQYHQAGAFIILSALLAGKVVLPTSFGTVVPNLWFMILADTCQPLDAKILTPKGWTTMGEIQIGDQVTTIDGSATLVTNKSPIRELESYEITFTDNTTAECSEDHLWTAKIDGYERIVPLSNIIHRRNMGRGRNITIPTVTKPVKFVEREALPVDPYILGIWLGEGCRSDKGYAAFANGEQELVEYVRERLPIGTKITNYTPTDGSWKSWTWNIQPEERLGSNPIRDYLVSSGLIVTRSWERFIPEEYKLASVEDRTLLLQGILDGEGTCMETGNIKMDSTSKQLIDDTLDLLRSLGCIAQCNGPRTARSGRLFWTITFTAPEGLKPFKLQRKLVRSKSTTKHYKGIKTIKPRGLKPVQCIEVATRTGLYVTNDYNVTHNTITRKSTAMDIATDLLIEVDSDAIMATDGSIEGLLTGLSMRSGRPSIFLRDEFSGLLEAMTKKDYMAGMAETLTKLYDGKYSKRILRKESIEIKDPVLILFAGGIRNRIQQLLTLDHVSSGFMPRFVYITAESDISRVKPMGPPIVRDMTGKEALLKEMQDMYMHYNQMQPANGFRVGAQPRLHAQLSEEAWTRFNKFEEEMLKSGHESEKPEILSPVYDRLGKSLLKAAVLLAASEQRTGEVKVELEHILHAISFASKWREYAIEVINGVGKSAYERDIERVLAAVKKRPGVSRSSLMQSFHLTANTANQLFDTMVQRNLITENKYGKGKCYWPAGYKPPKDEEDAGTKEGFKVTTGA